VSFIKFERSIVVWFTLAALLVATLVAASFWSFEQADKAAAARKHTFIVLNRTDDLLSALKDAETGQRGYLLTGDDAFLDPYLKVRDNITDQVNELRQLTLIVAAQRHMDSIAQLIDARLKNLSLAIELYKNKSQVAAHAAVSDGQGKRLMDSLRAEFHDFIQLEEAALAQHDAKFQLNMRRLIVIIAAIGIFLTVLALATGYFIHRQTHQQLNTTSALQRAIFDSANFSSIATDAKGVIQIFNVGAERMLGYTAAEVMDKITPADISDPQEVVARAKALSAELETPILPGFEALVFKAARGIEDIYELTYIRKDGSRFPAVVSVTALRDAQEAIIGYLLIGTDNTARKRAEEALLKAGALQRAIFDSANFSSIATDAKGVIQIFNVGAERMLGYTAAEVMDKITPADISDPQEVVARAKALSAELETPILPGFEALVFKAARGIEDIYELTYIRKDGSRFPAVVSVTALRDAQEAIIGYLLIGTDNTARKLVEAEQTKLDQRLRDQQFYTRSLIESNIDALMTTDPSGIITDVNKQMEALTGCTRDELIGAPFKGCFTDPERAEAGIKRVLIERRVTNYELTARARDGTETPVSYNATTYYDRNRVLQGVFAAARDITERKVDEDQLHFVMRELTHRTKNLLAVIQAMARQTARQSGSTENFLEKFNARLHALSASHDVLVQEQWQNASLADLARLQLAPYLDRLESQVSIEGPIVLLKPDAAQSLGFALHELATNAVKYGALSVPEGRVSIGWRRLSEAEGNGVELNWVESGGPAVKMPTHRGFGSMVIERNLSLELDSKIELAFLAEGLQCKIPFSSGQLAAIS
jgi:PAS domain S-box-containing protein